MIIPAKACWRPEAVAEGAIPTLHDHGIKAIVCGIERPDLEKLKVNRYVVQLPKSAKYALVPKNSVAFKETANI